MQNFAMYKKHTTMPPKKRKIKTQVEDEHEEEQIDDGKRFLNRPKLHYDFDDIDNPTTQQALLRLGYTNKLSGINDHAIDDVDVTDFPFPFKTKKNVYNDHPRKAVIKDFKLSHLKKYYRPYFSPKFHSWEMDYFSSENFIHMVEDMRTGKTKPTTLIRHYLIFININTKFIVVYPLALNVNPTQEFTLICLKDLVEQCEVTNLRGDNDKKFKGVVEDFCKSLGFKPYLPNSKYINKNRVVDRAIRTLKDAVGLDAELLLDANVVKTIVEYYNNTPHLAYKNKFTPQQVQKDLELEAWYIREQQMRLLDAMEKQSVFRRYEPGDLVLVYRPIVKTSKKFGKKRGNFSELARFIKYDHGNAKVELCKQDGDEIIAIGKPFTLPIYYIKFISDDGVFPPEFESLFN
jgi:hypothetical protein